MKKKALLIFFLSLVSLLHAGDAAEFINLGFSPDGRYMMFGQYGFSIDKDETYASIYTVDIDRNIFAQGGLFSLVHKDWIEPGDSGNGALLKLIEKASSTRMRYNVDYLKKGRLLYTRSTLNNEAKKADSVVEDNATLYFRDYQKSTDYTISLEQNIIGQGSLVESTFAIRVTMKDERGGSRNLQIGHPSFKRKGVSNYRIDRVILAPGEHALVLIVAKEEYSANGSPNIRYMVESALIN